MQPVQQSEPPTVRLIDPGCQPTREEPEEEDLRADATFEEALQAITRTVKVACCKPKRPRR